MHTAAQLHLASDRCVSPLVGCTNSTVSTLNKLQQGQALNTELCALTCALPPLPWPRSPASAYGAVCRIPDEPLINGI